MGSLTAAVGCKDKSSPAAPTPPTAPPVQSTLTAPGSPSPSGGTRLTDTRVTLTVNNAPGTLTGVKYRFEWSELDSFPDNSRTGSAEDIEAGSTTTTYTITDTLTPGFTYFWRARAYTATITGEWSATETFVTANRGFVRGQEIYDPLTEGTTVGTRVGGAFIMGQGWKALGQSDGIDYNIPTCTACTVEFDATDFGKGEGRRVRKDLKWLSMGDGSTWENFSAFRNHHWKMHLEQRGDGDGTGMKLIWRNGRNGDGDPGDHDTKLMHTGIDWRPSAVFHFTLTWDPGGYTIWVGEKQSDGRVTGNRVWFQSTFTRAYAPGNHRISIGTRTRDETLEATYRNFRVYPGRPRLDGE
jgi:hypothetical protein